MIHVIAAIYMRKSSPAYLDKNIIESGAPLSKYLERAEESRPLRQFLLQMQASQPERERGLHNSRKETRIPAKLRLSWNLQEIRIPKRILFGITIRE